MYELCICIFCRRQGISDDIITPKTNYIFFIITFNFQAFTDCFSFCISNKRISREGCNSRTESHLEIYHRVCFESGHIEKMNLFQETLVFRNVQQTFIHKIKKKKTIWSHHFENKVQFFDLMGNT